MEEGTLEESACNSELFDNMMSGSSEEQDKVSEDENAEEKRAEIEALIQHQIRT